MNPIWQLIQHRTRRHFLLQSAAGLGSIALAGLLRGSQSSASRTGPDDRPLAAKQPPQPARAKRVIYLHMTGSPPNLDMFDYKPELVKRSGQDCPEQFLKDREFAFTTGVPKLLGSPRKWRQHGQKRR